MAPRVLLGRPPSLLSSPYGLSEFFRSSRIRQHPQADAALGAFADSYRSRIPSRDDLLKMVDAYMEAKAREDTGAMAALEPKIAQALFEQARALEKVLRQARTAKKVDLQDPINRLRLSIGLKYGNLSLASKNTTLQSPFRSLAHLFYVYDIVPLACPDPKAWISLLQASFFAILDRNYAGNKTLFDGRDCLDREVAWGISIQLYADHGAKKLDRRSLEHVVFRKYEPKDSEKESVPDRGVLRQTFRGYSYDATIAQRLIELVPTDQEISLAKRRGRRHLESVHGLKLKRIDWLQARGSHVPVAKREYLTALAQSFGFEELLHTSQTSHVNENPDLFLVHQFLKEILWERFIKELQELASQAF